MADSEGNKLGILGATSYIVGTVIGSGIFVSPTAILVHAGSIGLSLIIWAVGGLIAMLSSLVFIELGTSIRESGGEFAYISYVGWRPFAFAFLWSTTLVTSSCSCAILVLTFGHYLMEALEQAVCFPPLQAKYFPRFAGFSLLLILSWTNFFSLKKYAGRVQIVIAAAKLLSVAIIIVTGFYFIIFKGRTENFTDGRLFQGTSLEADSIALSIYGGIWAYSGWDALNYGIEDIRNFRVTLPVSVVTGVAISIVIYLLANIAYFAIMTPQEMLDSSAVATTFSRATLGNFYYAMPAIVGVLMAGTMNSDIFMFSRFMFAGARRGQMPTCWALIHEESGSPRVAVLFHAIFAITFTFIGAVDELINYMIVCGMMQQVFAVSALVWIRWRRIPVHSDAIRFPLIFPIALILISSFLIVVPIWTDWRAAVVAGGIVAIAIVAYFLLDLLSPNPILIYLNNATTKWCQIVFNCTVADFNDSRESTEGSTAKESVTSSETPSDVDNKNGDNRKQSVISTSK